MLIADAMLECILDKRDEHQWRYSLVGSLIRHVYSYLYLVSISQLHQFGIGADKRELLGKWHTTLIALIEHKAHHLR